MGDSVVAFVPQPEDQVSYRLSLGNIMMMMLMMRWIILIVIRVLIMILMVLDNSGDDSYDNCIR